MLLQKLRKDFWIPQEHVLVRSVLNRCLTCKKLNAKPMTQQMVPLPKCRLTACQPPFSFASMDLCGPIYVKRSFGSHSLIRSNRFNFDKISIQYFTSISGPHVVPKGNSLKKNYRSEFLQSSFIFVIYLLKEMYRKIMSEIYFVGKTRFGMI